MRVPWGIDKKHNLCHEVLERIGFIRLWLFLWEVFRDSRYLLTWGRKVQIIKSGHDVCHKHILSYRCSHQFSSPTWQLSKSAPAESKAKTAGWIVAGQLQKQMSNWDPTFASQERFPVALYPSTHRTEVLPRAPHFLPTVLYSSHRPPQALWTFPANAEPYVVLLNVLLSIWSSVSSCLLRRHLTTLRKQYVHTQVIPSQSSHPVS